MLGATRLITVTTVDRSILSGLEWHLSLFATARASGCVHWAGITVAIATTLAPTTSTLISATLFARRTALRATAGGIGQPSAGIKLLLPNGKGKLPVAISAIQCLVVHEKLSFSLEALYWL